MEVLGFMINKWVTTALGIWIQCICGASYTFSIYSSALKSSQGYDQSTLDTVSVFKDIGANAGVISGFLYSAVTPAGHRRSSAGPWVVHAAGAIQCFVGYIFIWAAVSGLIDRPPVPAMCFFMFLAAHAQTFFNTANVVTGVHNFAHYSGTIVGIMKGYLGLSGALLIQVYNTTCNGEPSNFLLMLALLPTLLSIMFMWFVRIDKTESRNEMKHLNSLAALAVIVAFYLMVVIILNNTFSLSSWTRFFTFSILLILLAAPLGIAINAQREDFRRSSPSFFTEKYPVLNKPKSVNAEDSVEYHELPSDERQTIPVANSRAPQAMNVLEAICTLNFWLLFAAMVCGMGSGLATINNMSQLGQSLGYTATETKTFVSLWSIWNFLGRFGAGYTSDFLLHSYGWARPLLMAITLLIMSGGHIVIASGFSGNLYVGSILVGICYGSQWSLMPTITSEIFGLEHMGTIFNTIAIASPLGSYIFSVRVIGYIYDREATGKHGSCSGTHCFVVSFLVMAAVAFLGFLVAAALFFRTRRFYRLNSMESPSLSNRWIATVASIWIQCICGPSYTFGIYSSALKSTQNYDQSTLDTISVFKDIGATAGVLAGLLYSAVVSTNQPRRPWIVLSVGALQCFLGYIFIWVAVSGLIPRPPVPAMCLFMFLAVHAQVFFNTANVVTGVHNFQLHGGTILGILKGFLGLSGAVLIQFSNALCNRDPVAFLLMLAILPALTTLLLMRFVVIDKTETGNESNHLNSFSSTALIISGYLTILIILDNALTLPTWARILTLILLLTLIASPLGIAIRAQTEDSVSRAKLQNADDSFEYRQIPSEDQSHDQEVIVSDRDINLIEATGTVDFWVLFFSIMCSMGSGLATINNMNQLGQSLGYGAVEINTLVSLWSIWSVGINTMFKISIIPSCVNLIGN